MRAHIAPRLQFMAGKVRCIDDRRWLCCRMQRGKGLLHRVSKGHRVDPQRVAPQYRLGRP
jgi:hypothetical protein